MLDLTSKAMLAASIRVRMFAKRDTIDEALNYAIEVFDRVNGDDRAAVYTVLHVVLNTVADKIDALPDSEPSPADTIAHADLPDTGATSMRDQIIDIVDERIARLDIQRKIEKAIDEYDYEDIITNMVRNMNFTIDVE